MRIFLSLGLGFTLLAGGTIGAALALRAGPTELGRAALDRGDPAAVQRVLDAARQGPVRSGQVVPLVELALAMGDPALAAQLLERFLTQQPGHPAALRQLAEVLEQMRDSRRLAEVLETIDRQQPNAEHLRRASELHQSQGDTEGHARTLTRLFERGDANPDEALALANLLADRGETGGALDVLTAILRTGAGERQMEVLALAAVLAADQPARLAALGRLPGLRDRAMAIAGQALMDRAQPAAAATLLRAAPAAAQDSTEVMPVILEAELQSDMAAAIIRLDRLAQAGLASPRRLVDLLVIRSNRGEWEQALALLPRIPDAERPDWLGGWLLERLDAAGRRALLARLDIQGPPLLAAAAAMARGARAEATRLAEQAARRPPDSPGEIAILARLLAETGRDRAMLAEALREPRRMGALLPALAQTRAERDAALAALRPVRGESTTAAAGWALLATQAGQAEEVRRWLPSARLPASLLLELQAQALTRRETSLVAAATAALVQAELPAGWSVQEVAWRGAMAGPLTPALFREGLAFIEAGPESVARRVLAQMAAHPELHSAQRWRLPVPALPEGVEATTLLAILAPERATGLETLAQADPRRFGALYVAARARTAGDAAGAAGLRALLAMLPAAEGGALAHAAIALAPAQAAALERTAAEVLGGNWAFAVIARLERGGNTAQLATVLRQRAGDTRLPDSERLAASARLTEVGDRAGAVAALTLLATGKPPGSDVVRQLVFLHGPAASAAGLQWVLGRAQNAPAAERAAWLGHLDYMGGTRRAVALLGEWSSQLATDESLARQAGTIFFRAGLSREAAPLLEGAISAARNPAVLAALGAAAEAANQPRLMMLAFEAALNQRPEQRDWRVAAARAAAAAQRPERAAQHWRHVTRPNGQEALEAGDALRDAGQHADARRLYLAALVDARNDRLRARVLGRLGRVEEARDILDRLLAQRPNDAELRADRLEL